jgi:hypothetical protein
MPQQPSSKGNPFQDYVSVAERIEKFYQKYPEGRIITQIVHHDLERGFILMRAEVYRNAEDTLPAATGHAYEMKSEGYVQRTSYIEVGETSSVGRALAMAGFEVKRGIASREEMEKVARFEARQSATKAAPKEIASAKSAEKTDGPATDEQKNQILNLLEELRPKNRSAQRALLMEKTGRQSRDDLTQQEAEKLLKELRQEAPW